MILDPRLVPWADVAPGVLLSLVLAGCGWVISRWKNGPANVIFTLAPLVGWAWIIANLIGAWPDFPPTDAPLWALYFAVVGAIIAITSPFWTSCRWSRLIIAVALAIGLVAALRFLVVGSLHKNYIEELSWSAWPTLILAGVVVIGAIACPFTKLLHPACLFAPWITGLSIASACLTLTGTASLGLFALGLALTTMPVALASLLGRRPNADSRIGTVNGRITTPWHTWLPQVLALPTLMISGSLFASTPWHVANLMLTGVIGGTAIIYVWEILLRRSSRLNDPGTILRDLIAIGLSIVLTTAPIIIPIKILLDTAAADGFPY